MKRQLTIEIINSLLILLFVYTGINKFIEIDTLKSVLKEYPLSGGLSVFIAWALPITELIVSLLLFLPRTRLWGLYASLVLLDTFTLYLSYILTFTSKLPCTCGGMLQKFSWPQHLIFNIFFIILAIAAIWLHKKQGNEKVEAEIIPIVFT